MREEKKLRDPEDVYLEVRRKEAERASEGLPPRVQFLDEDLDDTSPEANQAASAPLRRGQTHE